MKAVFLDADSLGPADIDLAPLRQVLPDLDTYSDTAAEDVGARLEEAEVVIVNKVRLNPRTLGATSRLKLICLAATGTDNIDLDYAGDRGIAVCNIRNYCTPAVVQHVFALILALNQRLADYRKAVFDGAWQSSKHFCVLDFPFTELDGKTLGIVGLGTLGQGVARVAQSFGMRVIAQQRESHSQSHDGVARAPLDDLLDCADIVSLHCPLVDNTRNLIDADALRRMRPHALLINTARGGLVDTNALLAALRAGEIGGAGIDVLPAEPPSPGDPLVSAQLPNLIVTPHIAWAAREARQRAVNEIADNVRAYLAGQRRNRII